MFWREIFRRLFVTCEVVTFLLVTFSWLFHGFSWLFRGPQLPGNSVWALVVAFSWLFRGFFVAFSWPHFGQILRVLALEKSSEI